MYARTQIAMDPEMQRRAQARGADLGISFAEYIRRLVSDDLGGPKAKADISMLFDLVRDGPRTDIARDKDKMISEAVWENYLQSVGRKPGHTPRARKTAD